MGLLSTLARLTANAAGRGRIDPRTTVSLREIYEQIGRDGDRDIYRIYGYPRERSYRLYADWYGQDPYAHRIVTSLPRGCWRADIGILDGDGSPDAREEEVRRAIVRTGLLAALEKADILGRIGRYAVLYVGVPDGRDPREPVGAARGGLEEVYGAAYSEDGIEVMAYERDRTSPRYALPLLYSLTRYPQTDPDTGRLVETAEPVVAHWSRCIHLAEGATDSDIQGLPALSPVLNRLIDLNKALGGSAEAYYRNARGKIAYETDTGYQGMTDADEQRAFAEAARRFQSGWQDEIALVGMKAHVLDTRHDSPEHTVAGLVKALSAQTRIPLRVLTGEGGGQLRGSEDRLAWDQVVGERQRSLCEPWLRNVWGILATARLVEPLRDEEEFEWPPIEAPSEREEAETAERRARALSALAQALSQPAFAGSVDDPEQLVRDVTGVEISLSEGSPYDGLAALYREEIEEGEPPPDDP